MSSNTINIPSVTNIPTINVDNGSNIYPSTMTGSITDSIQRDIECDTINGVDITEFILSVSKRLLLLEDDFKKHGQYPALKEAYDRYKTIEALILEK